MVKSKNRLVALLLLVAMLATTICGGIMTVSATSVSTQDAWKKLEKIVETGKYGNDTSAADKTFKCSDGGFFTYKEIAQNGGTSNGDIIDQTKYDKLTSSSKKAFLEEMFRLANTACYDYETAGKSNVSGTDIAGITSETVDIMYQKLQNKSGMGSTLLATLMSNTKPNYASANALYKPFSGVVGTILGLLSIVIMALLGVTMGLDIAYIVIPPVQLALGGEEGGSGDGKGGKGLAGIISKEAKEAVKQSGAGEGSNGDFKSGVGIYFKYRWKGLVILGICLLYLVQGQIYSFVGWFIDLFSGFLGF